MNSQKTDKTQRKPKNTGMRRGEVARLAGLNAETLRYYENVGLLLPPARSNAGYREYAPDIIPRLRFIQSAKKLGFSLNEIRGLLEMKGQKGHPCADVREKAAQKIQDVDQKIAELKSIRAELSQLVQRCDGEGTTERCVILHALQEPEH